MAGYKNTFGTNPNSVVYGNGEKAQLQEYYFDQNGVKIKSGNTDWAKEIFGTALMQNYNLSLSKGFKDGNVALTLNYMIRMVFAVIQTTNVLIRV